MARVAAAVDGQTLLIERNGIGEHIQLAGIIVTDDHAARELMQWTLAGKWVMVEELPGGGALVYRSPDALFVNRELVSRGFARPTLPAIEPPQHVRVTYLGETLGERDAGVRRRSNLLIEGATKAARGNDSEKTAPKPARRSRPRRAPKP